MSPDARGARRRGSAAALAAGALAATALSAAACAAVRPLAEEEGLLLAEVDALLGLVERPEDLAIFPLADRTDRFAAGAAGAEVLATEMGRTRLFDGARVAEVRDRLLFAGLKWTQTTDDSEARRIAAEIGARAVLVGSVDEWRTEPNPVVAGTLRIRDVDGRILWVSSFSAEDRSIWTDRRRAPPTLLLTRAIGAAVDDLVRRLEAPAAARADSIAAVVEREAREAADDASLPEDDREVIERMLVDPPAGPNPFYRLRRLARDRREVHDALVAARYRRRLDDMRARAAAAL